MKWLGLLLGTLFALRLAHACPSAEDTPIPRVPSALTALETALRAHEANCAEDAGYLALRGAVTLELGRPGEAALHLERALLLDPRRSGAWLDYALALERLGETESAAALYHRLLEEHAPPGPLAQAIATRLAALRPSRRYRYELAWLAGYDSNLNGATRASQIDLTFPGALVTLPLAAESRARGGRAQLLEAVAESLPANPSDGLAWRLEARLREVPGQPALDSQQLDLDLALRRPLARASTGLHGGLYALRLGGDTLLVRARLFLEALGRPSSAPGGLECAPRLAGALESLRYPHTPVLDGRLVALEAGLACAAQGTALDLRLRAGYDAALEARPGGDQDEFELRLAAAIDLGRTRWQAEYKRAALRDHAPYSPLLEEGARRRIERTSLRLEASRPLARGWQLLASLERFRQSANLPLFETEGVALFFGVRWQGVR